MSAGDLNADGINDLAIGARDASYGTGSAAKSSGKVWVLFGPFVSGQRVDMSRPHAADAMFVGALEGDSLGNAVEIGDVDADGNEDLVAGAFYADATDPANITAGRVHVILGPLASGLVQDLAVDEADMTIIGSWHGNFGSAVALGDVNSDGMQDLVVGARRGLGPDLRPNAGAVRAFFGPLSRGTVLDLAVEDADASIVGPELFGNLGDALALGDVTGDGHMDLVMGAPGTDDSSEPPGSAYVLYGPLAPGPWRDLAKAPADLTITGVNGDDRTGAALGAGDVTGDGTADLLIGAPDAHAPTLNRYDCGVLHVLRGRYRAPATPGDRDGDGIPDACDLCPDVTDPGQEDRDGDGRGDACEECADIARGTLADEDLDGLADGCDNCPFVTNPDQQDSDEDGIGDACEPLECAATLREVDRWSLRVRRIGWNRRDLELSYDVAAVSPPTTVVNVYRGDIATLARGPGYSHQATVHGCGLASSPHVEPGAAGTGSGNAYYLAVYACGIEGSGREGSYGRSWDGRSESERPSVSELGLTACP